MELFDGFIAAIASEFKMKFNKTSEGAYTTTIEFENNRSQEILITLNKDESGDRIINYYSVIGTIKNESFELYNFSLKIKLPNAVSLISICLDCSSFLKNWLI